MKISIIMCAKDSMPYIISSIKSFQKQNYKDKELIVVYSKGKDTTNQYLNILNEKNIKIYNFEGSIYQSLNFGVKKTRGDIIGILHSDDIYFNTKILSNVAKVFKKKKIQMVYTNVLYSDRNNLKNIKRVWSNIDINKPYELPPHTGSFISKEIYNKFKYKTNFTISSDTDFLIRIKKLKFKNYYLKNYSTIMRTGGISTSFKSFFVKMVEDMYIFKKQKYNLITYLKKITFKINQIFFLKNISFSSYHNELNDITKIKLLNMNNFKDTHGKIISALNLAFISYNSKFRIQSPYNLFWPDGIFSKTISKDKKIPGRDFFMKYLNYVNQKPKRFNQIYVVGNINKISESWLKKNISQNFIFHKLKFGTVKEIISSYKKSYKKNSLLILTIPTPKQEMLANYIKNKNKDITIICLGGSINILSGYEKKTPEILNLLNLEWLWRLRFDTVRRILRLIETSYLFTKMLIFKQNKIH